MMSKFTIHRCTCSCGPQYSAPGMHTKNQGGWWRQNRSPVFLSGDNWDAANTIWCGEPMRTHKAMIDCPKQRNTCPFGRYVVWIHDSPRASPPPTQKNTKLWRRYAGSCSATVSRKEGSQAYSCRSVDRPSYSRVRFFRNATQIKGRRLSVSRGQMPEILCIVRHQPGHINYCRK